jgi:predicted small lipoprotein YifL
MATIKGLRLLMLLLATAMIFSFSLSGCGKKGPVRPISSAPAQQDTADD